MGKATVGRSQVRHSDGEQEADTFSNFTEGVGKINLSPSTPVLDGHCLLQLIELFLADRRARLGHNDTFRSHQSRLAWFVKWWKGYGPEREWLLTPADFNTFEHYLRASISELTKRPLSWNYRHDIMVKLHAMFRWACEHGYTERNYSSWVVNAEGAPPKRKAADATALTRLLIEASNGHKRTRTRDRAVIAMFLGMGLRRAEVSNVNVEDIVFREDQSGFAHIVGKKTRANRTGERDAAFDCATGKIVAEHLEAKRYMSGPLFRNQYGQRLGVSGVYQTVKSIINRAGLWKEIQACHDLRRAFTTYYARQKPGTDSADLRRRQLGHAQYSMTSSYTLYDVDDIRHDIVSVVGLVEPLAN